MEKKKIIEDFIINWHDVIKTKDFEKLEKLMAFDVSFISPVVYNIKADKNVVLHICKWIIDIIKGFNYTQEFYNYDELSLTLLFQGKIAEKDTGRLIEIQGVDLIKLNEKGQVTELRVMMRPLRSVLALREEMGKRLLSAKF